MKPAPTTGRYLAFFHDGAMRDGLDYLRHTAGVAPAVSSLESIDSGTTTYEKLGAALIEADPEQAARFVALDSRTIVTLRPERMFSLPHFVGNDEDRGLEVAPPFDESTATWALQATNVVGSTLNGAGVRVGVLDTGIRANHPDLTQAVGATTSFISGAASAMDDNGHDTFCSGIIAGSATPSAGPRYGIAPNAKLFVAKVLDIHGDGAEGGILAGMEWALAQQCQVISFSAATVPRASPDPDYVLIGKRARDNGCLIVAPVGNDSVRPDSIKPVSVPANVPAFVAVSAVNDHMFVAGYSNGAVLPGTTVDLAAPGVRIRSAWPFDPHYHVGDGTSAAVPHVAGIATLLLQPSPGIGIAELVAQLLGAAQMNANWNARDVGKGLVRL